MMKKTLLALAAAGVLASTGAVAANGHDTHGPVVAPVQYHDGDRWDDRSAAVNERESRINERIQRGIRDGRINEREARFLQRELSQIESKERSFNRDGRLSHRESEELNRDLDRLTDHVRQQIRD
jgi:Skp family chaperone for outer membrane proteins